MIKEVKVDGMEEFSAALVKMKKGTAPDITSGDDGKVLTASYDAEAGGSASWQDPPESVPEIASGDAGKVLTAHYSEGAGSMSWDAPETPASLVYDNTVTNQIGEYREHSGDTVTVYPIKSGVFSPVADVYLGNGSGAFEANIGNNAEILSCDLITKDSNELYRIPCTVKHPTNITPVSIMYTAIWDGTNLPSNGGPAKFYVKYIQRDNL